MKLRVDGKAVFTATGGRGFSAAAPAVVMIHGAGMDHVVWALQARSLAHRGRAVLVQYWATWSDRARADIPALKELLSKYGSSLSIIGVSLDNSQKDLADYLAEHRVPWPQIFEQGGLDSPPANQLGILTVPTMILLDREGKVVNRNIQTVELDRELKKLIP